MKLISRLAAATALALASTSLAGAASAQTYLGWGMVVQDNSGSTYWGLSIGSTFEDYSRCGWTSDIYDYPGPYVDPYSYWYPGGYSGWGWWNSNAWDTPINAYDYDYGYGSCYGAGDFSIDLFEW